MILRVWAKFLAYKSRYLALMRALCTRSSRYQGRDKPRLKLTVFHPQNLDPPFRKRGRIHIRREKVRKPFGAERKEGEERREEWFFDIRTYRLTDELMK